MGFMDKMKNLFTEEEEIIEEPVKKEVMHVEIKAPVKDESASFEEEREEIKEPVEVKPVAPAPVFFDDKDFVHAAQPKSTREKRSKIENDTLTKKTKVNNDYNSYSNNSYKPVEKSVKKVFEPSPIISPVYGILDKNYKKEDIVNKKEEFAHSYYSATKEITVDEVRKKAFGTLEDEIDQNLNRDEEKTSVDENTLAGDIFEEMDNKEDVVSIDNSEEEIQLGNVDLKLPIEEDEIIKKTTVKEEITDDDPIDDSDLFNLIDSMYERREEEE